MKKLKYLLKSLTLSVKIKTPLSMLVSILGLGTAFLPMFISLQLEDFTDRVQKLFQNPDTFSSVLFSFGLLTAFYIGQTSFRFAQGYYQAQDSARIQKYMKSQMLELLSSVPYQYIENYDGFREKVDFVNTFAAEKATRSIAMIFTWIANIISFISITVIIYRISPLVAYILIFTSIPAVILSWQQKDETYRKRTKFMKEGRFVLNYSDACRSNAPMKEIRYFGLYSYIKEKWKRLGKDWIKKKNRITRKHVMINSMSDILRNGVYLFVVLITVKEIYIDPSKGLGAFMLIVTAAGQLQEITASLLSNTVGIFSDITYMEDFFCLLDTEKEEVAPEDMGYTESEICFENVSFSYPNGDRKALNGLSVRIKPGEKIAIVGANGSGKSTFVNLLCGLYAPECGEAKINNVNICESLSKVRRSLSVVFQSFCKYQDTIRNNINVSVRSHSADEDREILELMKGTGADEVIRKDGSSLDEMIGLFSEKGRNLSGGQWQKIAITRSLMRKDASVYILDEPTAALDPMSEAKLYENFASLTGNKTTILISHRLGFTSIVDRILVFDQGKIVEDGSLDELLSQDGIFAKMYKAQAKWYFQ